MEVHDERVPEEQFAAFIEHMPQVCVEVLVRLGDGVVLGKRTNEPAKGEWFWPGGRLYKGERLPDAARRVAREELGLDVAVGERFGVYEHVWEGSRFGGDAGRHTVNVVYRADPVDADPTVALDDQHSDHRVLTDPDHTLHEYVRAYVADGAIPDGG